MHHPAEVGILREVAGGAEQHRGVAVVAAGVHLAGHDGAVGSPGNLADVKGVQISAKTDRALSRPLALQGSDDARLGDSIGDLDTPCAQVIGDHSCGPHFLEPCFGMLVDVVTDLDEFRLVALELLMTSDRSISTSL